MLCFPLQLTKQYYTIVLLLCIVLVDQSIRRPILIASTNALAVQSIPRLKASCSFPLEGFLNSGSRAYMKHDSLRSNKGGSYLHESPLQNAAHKLVRQNVQPAFLLDLACLARQSYYSLFSFSQGRCRRRCFHIAFFLQTDIRSSSESHDIGVLSY